MQKGIEPIKSHEDIPESDEFIFEEIFKVFQNQYLDHGFQSLLKKVLQGTGLVLSLTTRSHKNLEFFVLHLKILTVIKINQKTSLFVNGTCTIITSGRLISYSRNFSGTRCFCNISRTTKATITTLATIP